MPWIEGEEVDGQEAEMHCDMCGATIKKDDAVKCASCGVVLCLGCSFGGFCANCAGGDMD